MENYYPPDGYEKDEATGLYYQSVTVEKTPGVKVQLITCFNAQTGEFSQYEYEGQTAENDYEPKDEAESTKRKQKKVVSWIIGIGLAVGISAFLLSDEEQGSETAKPDKTSNVQIAEQNQEAEIPETTEKSIQTDASEEIQEREQPSQTVEPPEAEDQTTEPEDTGAKNFSAPEDSQESYDNEIPDEIIYYLVEGLWMDNEFSEGTAQSNIYEITQVEEVLTTQLLATKEVTAEKLEFSGFIGKVIDKDNPYYFERMYRYQGEVTPDGNMIVDYSRIEDRYFELKASSEQKDQYGSYPAANVIDGDPTTAWVPAGGLDAAGEYLTFTFEEETTVYGVAILNGYWKSQEAYDNNGMAIRMELYADGGAAEGLLLSGADFEQDVLDEMPYNIVHTLGEPMTTTELNIVIAEGIAGVRYEDICVSEILLLTD